MAREYDEPFEVESQWGKEHLPGVYEIQGWCRTCNRPFFTKKQCWYSSYEHEEGFKRYDIQTCYTCDCEFH